MVEIEVLTFMVSLGWTIRTFVCSTKTATRSSIILLVLLNSLQYCELEAFRKEDSIDLLFFLDGLNSVKLLHLPIWLKFFLYHHKSVYNI